MGVNISNANDDKHHYHRRGMRYLDPFADADANANALTL